MDKLKEGDQIIWSVNRKKLHTGTVTKIGTGPDAGLVFARGRRGIVFTLRREEIIEINGEKQ